MLPFSSEAEILKYTGNVETPFYLYDKISIQNQCRRLKMAFSWAPNFQNYFAMKATPNPHILNIIKNEGFGVDCSSYTELQIAEAVGFAGDRIFFTANNTTIREYQKAIELGAIVNLDDPSHVQLLHDNLSLPDCICLRYNPGSARGNSIIGNPEESKFGMTKEQLFQSFVRARALGCKRFFLHTMVVSNCLDEEELVQTATIMFNTIKELKEQLNIIIACVDLGGGIGIPYKPDEMPINLNSVSDRIKALREDLLPDDCFKQLKICFECGRFITGPAGILVTRVINKKATYKNYLGVDASIANLMRPAMYGAYHHITHISAGNNQHSPKRNISHCIFDVVGSLCENNDKLAIDRHFDDDVHIGDILVLHDVGAHCSAMAFNYNGKLRCAEYLIDDDPKELILIRRAETLSDLLSTFVW